MTRIDRAAGWLFAVFLFIESAPARAQVAGYPNGVREVTYQSDGDQSLQPALIWHPQSDSPIPLLVALHTWSSDFRQAGGEAQYANWCQQANWAFVHPNFRGINETPSSMGSDLAVADIRSAVAFAKTQANIDSRRIYLVGVSGGGHASLLMAAREPGIWAGVSAWCGISDIAAWHHQCKDGPFDRYSKFIESVLGGSPDSTEPLRDAARHRSPLHWLGKEPQLPTLDINHGINDGRAGSVPFTHALHAWNSSVPEAASIPISTIDTFYETRMIPSQLQSRNQSTPDELYGDHPPLFRLVEGSTRLRLFDGGHEIVHEAALNWLAAQKKGQAPNWNPGRAIPFSVGPANAQSGK